MASTEEAATASPVSKDTAISSPENDVDEEAKMLMNSEISCIFETRLERADRCRQRGSAAFKDGNREKAVEWYKRALRHVDFDEGTWHFEFTDKNRADVNVVRLPVYLNLAACYLVEGAPEEGTHKDEVLAKVVKNVNLALAIDPENGKALYRGGRALLLMGDLEGAREKLTKAVKHHPSDRSIREAMTLLKEKLAVSKKEEKERWGGRLLPEKDTRKSRTVSQEQQLQKPRESSNTLWIVAVVLMGIALALGQLSFVE
ncbi:hypothetical protein PsorP6_006487 [Peronosclerospora sorghi]|uniref:Uncharacterized protein n=1 Tax=Peronosclerospora sorghi TaxID=230839 RepID=A0ACC0W6B6_9STRA|nr:hypothetical protein PsorP6_006487 [Peronosclerospora sorghi]